MEAEQIYDRIGETYAHGRRPEPRWQSVIDDVVGAAQTVLNVGAGTGSYEPTDTSVVAVEPSRVMIDQRQADAPSVIQAVAEDLPFGDQQFDVATAFVTIHHWRDWRRGLSEMRRVAQRAVVLHFDPDLHTDFWLARDYFPRLIDVWGETPRVAEVAAAMGHDTDVIDLPVPWDCVDGFLPAYWRRPEAYLDPLVRQSMSGFQLLDQRDVQDGVDRLAADLADGAWARRNAGVLELEALDAGWRLIVSAS